MNTRTIQIKAYILLILSCAVIPFLPDTADAAVSYTVEPQSIELKVQPRDIIKREVVLTNNGTQPVTIYPSVNNISLRAGGTIEEFLSPVESDRTASLASWIEVSRQGIDLKPGETRKVSITVRVNPQPKPGTYHAVVGFGYGEIRDHAEGKVRAREAPMTVFTVTYEEKKNEILKLAGFIVDRFVTKPENNAARYTFKNPGDEALIPRGEIIIYDPKGVEVGAVLVNEEGQEIQPGGEHTFTEQLPMEGMFGKYKAFLSIEYGVTQKASVQDSSYFYVLPLEKILVIAGILALLVIFASWYIHKKYFDDTNDDSDRIHFHVKESKSEPMEHDVDLKKK